jgi:enoyl-[acyl-carrier protein] reductase/trans-2-enoyl-CoA reductase (NAD+)
MKEVGTHEDCIQQIVRLFADRLAGDPAVDAAGRIRVDDWEMRDEIQAYVAGNWQHIATENLRELSDFDGYQENFLKLFGFGLPGVDYEADTDPNRVVDLVG